MSDHVVVKRERLKELIEHAAEMEEEITEEIHYVDFAGESEILCDFRAILSAPSPEMVPWAEVEPLLKALESVDRQLRARNKNGKSPITTQALAAFNAKFKP